MTNNNLGKFEVLNDTDLNFRFSSDAGEFTIDGMDSTLNINSIEQEETILLDEILRLEYGTMTHQLPPNSWKKLWMLVAGGFFLMELLGNSRDEAKWFQISAVLRGGEKVPLYLAKHLNNVSNTQIAVAHQLEDAINKHGFALDLIRADRVADDIMPQISEMMHDQANPKIDKGQMALWVALNLIAVFIISMIPVFLSIDPHNNIDPSFDDSFLGQLILLAGGVLYLGGGIVISSFQWLMIRRYFSRMQGFVWLGAGLVSSGMALAFVTPIALLMLFESSSIYGRLVSIIILISGHLFFLNLVQASLWPLMTSGNFKTAVIWGFANSVAIVLAFLGFCILALIVDTNIAHAIIGEVIILILAFVPGGFLIARIIGEKRQA